MKSPKWVATTRQLIKSKHGFGWSISNWERNNKLITKAVWVNLGSKSDIAENLRLEKVRENLTERQYLVLTFVEDRDNQNKGMFTTSEDLAENFPEEFGGSKVKALASLNQLENKKLIYSKPRNFDGKGKVLIFYPNKK